MMQPPHLHIVPFIIIIIITIILLLLLLFEKVILVLFRTAYSRRILEPGLYVNMTVKVEVLRMQISLLPLIFQTFCYWKSTITCNGNSRSVRSKKSLFHGFGSDLFLCLFIWFLWFSLFVWSFIDLSDVFVLNSIWRNLTWHRCFLR